MSLRYNTFIRSNSSYDDFFSFDLHDICNLNLPNAIAYDSFGRLEGYGHDTSEYLGVLWEVISGNWWTASGSLYTDSSNARIRFKANYPQISGDWLNYNFLTCKVTIRSHLPDDYTEGDGTPKDVCGGGLIDVNNGEYVAKGCDYYSKMRLENFGTVKTRYGNYFAGNHSNTDMTLYINPNDAIYLYSRGYGTIMYEPEDDIPIISSVCLGTSELYSGQMIEFDNFAYLIPRADVRVLGTQQDIQYNTSTYMTAYKQIASDMIFTDYKKDCFDSLPMCDSCYQGRFPKYFQITLNNYVGTGTYKSIKNIDLSQFNGTYILSANINSVDAYGSPSNYLYKGVYNDQCGYSYIGNVFGEDGEELKLLLRVRTPPFSASTFANRSLYLDVATIIPEHYATHHSFHIHPITHGNLMQINNSLFYYPDFGLWYWDYTETSYVHNLIGIVYPSCSPSYYLEWYYDDYWDHWEIPNHSQAEKPIEYADFSTHKLWVQATGVWVNNTYFNKVGIRDEINIPDLPGKYAVYYDFNGALCCNTYPVNTTNNMVFDCVYVKHFFGIPVDKEYDANNSVWIAKWATDSYRYLSVPKLNMTYIPTYSLLPNYSTAHSRISFSHGFDNKDDSILVYNDNSITIKPSVDSFRIATVQYPVGGTWLEDIYPYANVNSRTEVFYTQYKKPITVSVPASGTWYLCYVLKQSKNRSYDYNTSGRSYMFDYNINYSDTVTFSQVEIPHYGGQMWFELCWVTGLEQHLYNEYIDRRDEITVLGMNTELFLPSSDYALYTVYAHKVPIAKVDCYNSNITNFEDLRTNIVGTGIVCNLNVEYQNPESIRATYTPYTYPYDKVANAEYQGEDSGYKWGTHYNLFGTLQYMPFAIEFNDASGIISIVPKHKFYIHIGNDIIEKIDTESVSINKTKLQRRYYSSEPYIGQTRIFDVGSYPNDEGKDMVIILGQGYICGYDINGDLLIEESEEVYKYNPFTDTASFDDIGFYHHNGDIVVPLFLTSYNKLIYHRFLGKNFIVRGYDYNSPYNVVSPDFVGNNYSISNIQQSVPAIKTIGNAGFRCKEFDHVLMSGGIDNRLAYITAIV